MMKTRMPKDIYGLLDSLELEDVYQPSEIEIGARCPMHLKRSGKLETRTDHWFLNLQTGLHHCFSCGYKGNLLKLVMDVGNLDLWEALRRISAFGVDLESLTDLPEYERQATTSAPPTKVGLDKFGDPPAEALTKRHLSAASAASYDIRWDRAGPHWILPIYSPEGDLWGYQKKSATKGGTALNRPRRIRKSHTLFGLNQFRGQRMILVESPLDVVYIHEVGFPFSAVASYGASVSDVQLRLMLEKADELVLALDNDEAGIAETERIIGARWHRRIPIQVFNYRVAGRWKDPGDMLPGEFKRGLTESTLAMFWRPR